MKIILTQIEIEEAIKAHVGGLVTVRDGTDIGVSFASTRGEDGIVATIDITYLGTTSIPAIVAEQTGEAKTATPQKTTTVAVGTAPAAKPRGRPPAAAKNLFEDAKPAAVETADGGSNPPDIDINDESKPDPVNTAVTAIADAVDEDAVPETKTEGEEAAPATEAPAQKKSLFS